MVPQLPQEIVDRIIDEIALEACGDVREQARDMKMFSLISSKWLYRSRKHLFHTMEFSNNFPTWCESVRPGIDGPSPHITCIRYKPSWVQVERKIGPLQGLSHSPSHMSSFTNLRTLHFVDISLQHTSYLTCFGRLPAIVRELWLEDCQMDINQFISFLQPFTNLERLRLMRPQCADENKLDHSVLVEPPRLKGTLEFYQPKKTASDGVTSFTHELSLVPSYFSTIFFWERLDTPKAANELLVASRRTLTKLTFGHYSIPKGINLKHLDVLKELELSTMVVWVLPSVLRTVKSSRLESIRFILLIHQLEDLVEEIGESPTRRSWFQFDFELCALANRIEAAKRYTSGELRVKLTDANPATTASEVEELVMLFLPRSWEHRYISFSVE